MLLVTAATYTELEPLQKYIRSTGQVESFITGVGPITAAAGLSKYLALHGPGIGGVLNIGVAGAYISSGVDMLDICMAKQEFLGDFGICMQDEIMDLDPGVAQPDNLLVYNNTLCAEIENILLGSNIAYKTVNFVTVNCASGTQKRGNFLRDKFGAGCENMEGGGVALACRFFEIPCVQLRCISNMVEDRKTDNWQLEEAIDKICRMTEIVLQELV